ncbi:MAG: hypothetical protein JKY02_10320 [Flavobacteriaceae bacterium]|nr:hypothetical protein [Flavobacteriaceae bacterium]
MSSISNQDGGPSGDQFYGGTYMDQFDYEVDGNPRQSLTILTQESWSENSFVFVANPNGSGESTVTFYPRRDGAFASGNNGSALEVVNLSVDSINALQVLDTDGDGIPDSIDIDDDNDGILDTEEYGIAANPNDDADGDLIPNYLDTDFGGPDADTNGVPDAFDFDGDGIPNHLDLDSDNDGILDNIESQTGAGFTPFNATDTDNDGLADVYDATPTTGSAGSIGIIPNVFDSGQANDDTTPDYLDIDTDDDGIPDNVEAQTTLGYTAPTGNVGLNGVDSSYENVDTYTPTGITIVNTDITDLPDYRDTDSDNDGITDINENGEGNVLSGSDTDGDGLDNNFDADNTNYDVNDDINTPSTDLPDVDIDVNTGGDVDFRDDVTGLDSDGDKIPDAIDIDDDDDGIIDTEECSNAIFPAGGANAITVDVGVAQKPKF